MNRVRPSLVWVLALGAAASAAGADGPPSRAFRAEGHGRRVYYYFPDDEVRRVTALHDVVTPHIAWARPLRGGPVRVLAIAHKSQGRWPVELAQRFDARVTTVYGHSSSELGSPADHGLFVQRPGDVQARLLQAMNEPIDMLITDIPPKVLGAVVCERLLGLIGKGVGYVGSVEGLELGGHQRNRDAEHAMIKAAAPIAGLRAVVKAFPTVEAAAGKIVRLWTRGDAGRIADLTGYPRDAAAPEANRLQYLWLPSMEEEAWFALVGRAVLWASRRVEAGTPLQAAWPREPIDRRAMPHAIEIAYPAGARLRVRVWDADGRLRHEGDKPIVPRFPAGRYFVGVEAFRDGVGSDWAFGSVRVASQVGITDIALDSAFKDPGEKVRATVTLSDPPPPGSTLRIDVLDGYARSVCRREPPAAKAVAFEGDFAESLHIYNTVNVALVDADGGTMAEDRRGFYVAQPGPPRDDVSWIVWEGGAGFEPRRRALLKQFARLGMAGALTGGLDAVQSLAMADVHPILYAYKMTGVRVNEQGVASPCLTSPSYREHTIRTIQDEAERYRPYAPYFFYLGDDARYTSQGQDACWSPTCRAGLAAWAKQRYETIDRLNVAWGTSYATFDDVAPVKQAVAKAAADRGELGPLCHFVDHQIWTDRMVAEWWREMGKGIRKTAPDTPSNMGSCVVGWTWPGSGIDFWQLAEGKDLVFQYPNPWVHDIFRSAAAPDALHGTWYGGYGLYTYPPYYDGDYLPWWSVFRGVNLHGLYYGGQGRTWYSERLLGADLGPMPAVARMLDNLNELKRGTAKLLFNAKRMHDGMAMVYAPANIHASLAFADGLPKAREWHGQATSSDAFVYMQCWEGMSSLLSDMGFGYEVVHATSLESGTFLGEGYRALVLPFHIRLTEGEAQTIRRFVRDGGTVIADALPGLFDGRCRTDHGGVLADVFGVELVGGLQERQVRSGPAETTSGEALGPWVVDAGVRLRGAEATAKDADGTPLLMVNRFGQGCAVLLNVLARDYQIRRTMATEMPFRDAVAGLLADRGVMKPAIGCEVSAAGEDEPHRIQVTEFHRYQLDGADYVGVLRHPKLRADDAIYMADLRPKPAWITLHRKAHVYDVRRRMYRGMTDRLEDVIYPARAELFALLPYEVRGLELAARMEGPALTYSVEIVPGDADAKPVTHVFHVRVIDPSGRDRREYRRNVAAKSGSFQGRVFLGHNAEAGTWRVTVRDVASGMQRTSEVMR